MQINTEQFGHTLKEMGFNFYSGVPCSFLNNLINYAINECEYVIAPNEGEAVAICAGAHIGGRKTVFLCQNSGLTNAVSPLTSLNYTFKIPTLGFVSLRGEEGINDEPQHELMGQITTELLDTLRIRWAYLSKDQSEAMQQLALANKVIEDNKSFFFVVRKNTFEKVTLNKQNMRSTSNHRIVKMNETESLPTRHEVLSKLIELTDKNSLNIATTGFTGRELYEIEDKPNNLYMVGSMGCVSSLSLGLALTQKERDIVAIDGDGAFLMRMGSISSNAYYSPGNFFHLLLDNNVHDSTGGQLTVSSNIDFVEVVANAGYTNSVYLHNLSELEQELKKWKEEKELTFAYLKIAPGTMQNLGRPKIKPYEVKERLMAYLEGDPYD